MVSFPVAVFYRYLHASLIHAAPVIAVTSLIYSVRCRKSDEIMRYYDDNECLLASMIQIPPKYRKFHADKDDTLNMDHHTTLCCFLFKDLGALRRRLKVFIVKAAISVACCQNGGRHYPYLLYQVPGSIETY